MKKSAFLLALILSVPFYAHAQELQINDTAIFQPTAFQYSGDQLSFTASFDYNVGTGVITNMMYSESDSFGIGPFAAPTYESDVYIFNFFAAGGTAIQIGDEVPCGGNYPCVADWPTPGSYGEEDTVLLCARTGPCNTAFSGAGYVPALNGTLTIKDVPAETPEPSTLVLLAAGGMLFGLIEFVRRRA
jgi:PEP-CTERM motif